MSQLSVLLWQGVFLRLCAECPGRQADAALEDAAECKGIFVPDVTGDFLDGKVGFGKELLRLREPNAQQILIRRNRRKVQLFCGNGHGFQKINRYNK